IYPETQGLHIGVFPGTGPAAMAAQGSRVFLVGSQSSGSPAVSKGWFVVLQPDRTEDTTFTGAFTIEMDGDTFSPDQAYYSNSNDDVALLHVPTGFKMNGTRTGYTFPGFASNLSSLVNTSGVCKGYGANAWNDTNGTYSGGGFQLRGGVVMFTS